MRNRNIRVDEIARPAVADQEVEIVERKGLGHPDSLCDGIAERVSATLAREYLNRTDEVLHFNTDETQLVAGSASPAFGGGEMVEPIYVLLVGRATKEYEGAKIPVESLALRAAREYLADTVPHLNLESDIVLDVKIGEGSGELQTTFSEDGRSIPMANDTSFGVGHAPLSPTEQIVLATERELRTEFQSTHPAIGPDIKVMGKREGDDIDLTVAVALIDEFVPNMEAYKAEIQAIQEFIEQLAYDRADGHNVNVSVNTADEYDTGSIYLTTTGTSAEQGDDGSVGRGNRANGLITPNRSMSLEATSGKNPVNHIGKIYNLLSTEIATNVVEEVSGIRDLRIRLLSQIGQPIDQPQIADAHVVTDEDTDIEEIKPEITDIMNRELKNVTDITEQIIEGELRTF